MEEAQAGHIGPMSSLAEIGDYNIYILEIYPKPRFEDEITKSLDNNFKKIAQSLGEEGIYIELTDISQSGIPDTLTNASSSPSWTSWTPDYPILLILEEHPKELPLPIRAYTEDDINSKLEVEIPKHEIGKCLSIELGGMNDSTEVTAVLRTLVKKASDEDFMTELTWEVRKNRLKDALSGVVDISSLSLTLLTLGI